MTTKEKLAAVRQLMSDFDLDAYIVPITDPHMSEYVPDHWRGIQWLSGFTGSAGTIVLTNDFAGLWTDSRYFLQAENQLSGSGINLMKLKIPHTPEFIDWLAEQMSDGSQVGYHGEVISVGLAQRMEGVFTSKNITIRSDVDLLSPIWKNRASFPMDLVFEHDHRYTGLTRGEKLTIIREKMEEQGITHSLLSSLDDIAWTFNIRGSDSSYSPLVVSFVVIGKQKSWLFIEGQKVPGQIKSKLIKDGIQILPYQEIYNFLAGLNSTSTILLSPSTVNKRLFDSINRENTIVEELTIPTKLKSIKNKTELDHIRETMIKEGHALVQLFYWLESSLGTTRITERTIDAKIHKFRSQLDGYKGPSFATIVGYKEHGAIIHYEATEETDAVIKPEGILLLDTGGQYLGGTTDMTRTVALGSPTNQQKRDFTLVLKGMIQLALMQFPKGTRGYQIEAFARQALWKEGLNYGHGTGHGVGYFLNVHEGPQTIGTGASGDHDIALEPGMIISDEPGFYREGQYGIRTENLILVEPLDDSDPDSFLRFETLTLCHIDTSLVEKSLLTEVELDWLNQYHEKVWNSLSPALEEPLSSWLKTKVSAI